MSETFFGRWSVQVVQKKADFGERLRIAGSESSDGTYAANVGTTLNVVGEGWTLTMEWNDNVSTVWYPSDVRKSAEFTLQNGLVITLGVDDNTINARDFDYDDVILVCRNLDPELTPFPPTVPFDFTLPKTIQLTHN